MTPCLSKFSSRKMQTSARNEFTSRKYRTVLLFSLMMLAELLSNGFGSPDSLMLLIRLGGEFGFDQSVRWSRRLMRSLDEGKGKSEI